MTMNAEGTCIVSQTCLEAGLVTASLLQTAGFRIKQVPASSAADMIMSKAGITVGFVLITAAEFSTQSASRIDSRC